MTASPSGPSPTRRTEVSPLSMSGLIRFAISAGSGVTSSYSVLKSCSIRPMSPASARSARRTEWSGIALTSQQSGATEATLASVEERLRDALAAVRALATEDLDDLAAQRRGEVVRWQRPASYSAP